MVALPPPAHGILPLVGDGSHADHRGPQNPVAQTGRIRQQHPWFFGRRFVLLMAAWDDYRVPVGVRRRLPKCHAAYRSAKVLFRAMVEAVVPPRWPKQVSVDGEAAYGAQANMVLVKARDKADTPCRWGLVLAIARTWKTVEEQSRKTLVPSSRTRMTKAPGCPERMAGKGARRWGRLVPAGGGVMLAPLRGC
jgi:hypothetical protein